MLLARVPALGRPRVSARLWAASGPTKVGTCGSIGGRPHVMASMKDRGGGGRDSAVPAVGSVLKAADLASSKLMAQRWPSAATGSCPPGTPGLEGISGVGAPTMGALTLARGLMPGFSGRGLCTVKRAVGNVSWHGCRGGDPGRWSAWLALRRAPWRRWWRCLLVVWAARGIAEGGSGALSVSGGAPIRLWGSELVVLLPKTSWWHAGSTERKLCALAPTTATLVGATLFLKTSSWCSPPCPGSG